MFITQKEWYSVEQCLANPQNLYVFGDNTIRKGKGGQAQIRDCENSFGIATKILPTRDEDAYFKDNVYAADIIGKDIRALLDLVDKYENIVFPYEGLGTGLSEMPTRCPLVFRLMSNSLYTNFDFTNPGANI